MAVCLVTSWNNSIHYVISSSVYMSAQLAQQVEFRNPVIQGSLVRSSGEALFPLNGHLSFTSDTEIMRDKLSLTEKLVATGLLSRKAGKVDWPPRYDQKYADICINYLCM